MALARYISRFGEVQEMVQSATHPIVLLRCENDLIRILLDAESDSDLTSEELDEIWGRREILLIEIYEKYPTLRNSMADFLPNLRY